MEFQELDFHKVLYQAYLEPPGARNQFLDRIRKKESYKREEFLIKLEEALDHFKQAFEIESKKVVLRNVEDFGFPISALTRYEPLRPFASNFSGHISKAVLNDLGQILALYKFEQTAKRVNKLLDRKLLEAEKKSKTDQETEIKNTFNSMPIEEVREHFRPLTEKKNRISGGEIWMTKEDFEIFLRRSFGGESNLPKPKIKIGSKGKYAVVKLFHSFYEKTLDHPYNGPREIDPVFNLLKNAFETSIYDNERKDNFKNDKSKYSWS
jgi:hypothetical protein